MAVPTGCRWFLGNGDPRQNGSDGRAQQDEDNAGNPNERTAGKFTIPNAGGRQNADGRQGAGEYRAESTGDGEVDNGDENNGDNGREDCCAPF